MDENLRTIGETEALVRKTLPDIVKIDGTGCIPGTPLARMAIGKGWASEGPKGLIATDYPFKVDVEAERKKILNKLHEVLQPFSGTRP